MDPFIIAGISVLYLAMMIIVGNHYAQNGFGPGLIIFGGLFWPLEDAAISRAAFLLARSGVG